MKFRQNKSADQKPESLMSGVTELTQPPMLRQAPSRPELHAGRPVQPSQPSSPTNKPATTKVSSAHLKPLSNYKTPIMPTKNQKTRGASQVVSVIAQEFFQTSLVTYLLLTLAETLKEGFVSNFFNMNYLLLVVLVSGIAMVLTEPDKTVNTFRKRASRGVIILAVRTHRREQQRLRQTANATPVMQSTRSIDGFRAQ